MVRTPTAKVKRLDGNCRNDVQCYFFRDPLLRLRVAARLRGTFPPARRASLSPIAIACFRLVTFRPEPPDRSVPRLRSCIARFTLL